MAKYKYSVNPKLNAFLQGIEDDLMEWCDTPEESINEMKRYKRTFPHELDYNIAQYGNLLVSSYQVEEYRRSCGYSPKPHDCDEVWEKYKQAVGAVVRTILKKHDHG